MCVWLCVTVSSVCRGVCLVLPRGLCGKVSASWCVSHTHTHTHTNAPEKERERGLWNCVQVHVVRASDTPNKSFYHTPTPNPSPTLLNDR
mmetsp:Transcript_53064/g.124011  ORF Transcript_53064/g.124011 Transcript_53064/m.124011 type:complete len:90 (-) Transcript_53064:47-316(-)